MRLIIFNVCLPRGGDWMELFSSSSEPIAEQRSTIFYIPTEGLICTYRAYMSLRKSCKHYLRKSGKYTQVVELS